MKIIQITSRELYGTGLAESVARIQSTLESLGVEVRIASPSRLGKDLSNRVTVGKVVARLISMMTGKWSSFAARNGLFDSLLEEDAVFIIHSIQDGVLSWRALEQCKAWVVWIAHDWWISEGVSHLPVRRNSLYGRINTIFGERKLSKFLSSEKRLIVCVSEEMKEYMIGRARLSEAISREIIRVLPPVDMPNGSNVSPYAKYMGDLEKTLLVGARNYWSDRNKGSARLKKMLRTLKSRADIEILVFGEATGMRGIVSLGFVETEEEMRCLYERSSVYLVTSYDESFCISAYEALSTGTPVVCFEGVGIASAIKAIRPDWVIEREERPEEAAKKILRTLDNRMHSDAEDCRKVIEALGVHTFDTRLIQILSECLD